MPTTTPDVAIRLGVTGDDQVEATFASVAAAGDASTKRLAASFDRLSSQADQAAQRATAAGQRLATALSIGGSGVSVGADQNAQVKAFQAYMADAQRQAEALRNAIDPLRVAQAAYDRELEVASSLLKSGNITQDEYTAAVKLAATTFDGAKASVAGLGEAHNRMGASGLIADHVVRSLSDSIAAGRSPAQALTLEIGRVSEAMQIWAVQSGETEGVVGSLAEFMGGPWGLAITVGIASLTPLIGKLFETDDAAAKAAAQGLADFQKRQQDLARFVDTTTGKLKEQVSTLAKIASIQYPGLVGAKGVESQGDVNLAFATARSKIAQEGSTRAGPKDAQLSQAVNRAGSSGSELLANLQALVKTRPDLQGLLNTIAGYVGEAQDAFEAGRKLQSNQADLNTALHGGTVITTEYIDRLNDQKMATDRVSQAQEKLSELQSGKATIDAMNDGSAKTKALQDYATQTLAARKEVEAAQAAEKAASAAAREHAKDLRDAAKAAAEFQKALDTLTLKLGEQNDKWAKKMAEQFSNEYNQIFGGIQKSIEARQQALAKLATQDADQRDALAASQDELATLGMTAEKRQVILDLLTRSRELQREGADFEGNQARQILAGVAAQDALNVQLSRASAAMEEVRNFGDQLVDDLSSGRSIAKDIVAEFEKLALINPLKNLINGNSNLPTLTSAISAIGKLFGGTPKLTYDMSAITGNAAGTNYFSGGLTWIAENGPELVSLPRGTQIANAPATRRMLSAANDRQPVQILIAADEGSAFVPRVAAISGGQVAAAAPGIAYGGAALGEAKLRRRARRTMR